MKRLIKAKVYDNLFATFLVLYALIHFAVFWLYVNFDTIVTTFQKFNYNTQSYEWNWLNNYIKVFKLMLLGDDPSLNKGFWNSFQAIGINLIILPIAIFSAYAFYKKMPLTGFFNAVFYIPQLISVVVLAMAYCYMFDAKYGPITIMLKNCFGVNMELLSPHSDTLWPIIWIYCIWSGIGANVIMMRSAMNKVPKEVSESVILEGCGFFQELWYITLPMSISTIGVYLIQTMGSASGFLMAPMLIAGSPGNGGKFNTIAWFIFANANVSDPNSMITIVTVGIMFTLLNTPLIVGTRILVKKLTPDLA